AIPGELLECAPQPSHLLLRLERAATPEDDFGRGRIGHALEPLPLTGKLRPTRSLSGDGHRSARPEPSTPPRSRGPPRHRAAYGPGDGSGGARQYCAPPRRSPDPRTRRTVARPREALQHSPG